jgi:hypothetical protein
MPAHHLRLVFWAPWLGLCPHKKWLRSIYTFAMFSCSLLKISGTRFCLSGGLSQWWQKSRDHGAIAAIAISPRIVATCQDYETINKLAFEKSLFTLPSLISSSCDFNICVFACLVSLPARIDHFIPFMKSCAFDFCTKTPRLHLSNPPLKDDTRPGSLLSTTLTLETPYNFLAMST